MMPKLYPTIHESHDEFPYLWVNGAYHAGDELTGPHGGFHVRSACVNLLGLLATSLPR